MVTAVEAAAAARPDVAVVDLRLPDMDGVEVTRRLLAVLPNVRVLMLTMHLDGSAVMRALAAGAAGYVLKDAPHVEVVGAVRSVAAGSLVIGPGAAGPVRAAFVAPRPEIGALTPREKEMLELLAQGLPTATIALHLHLAPKTVRNRLSEVFTKLGGLHAGGGDRGGPRGRPGPRLGGRGASAGGLSRRARSVTTMDRRGSATVTGRGGAPACSVALALAPLLCAVIGSPPLSRQDTIGVARQAAVGYHAVQPAGTASRQRLGPVRWAWRSQAIGSAPSPRLRMAPGPHHKKRAGQHRAAYRGAEQSAKTTVVRRCGRPSPCATIHRAVPAVRRTRPAPMTM